MSGREKAAFRVGSRGRREGRPETLKPAMFISITRPAIQPEGPDAYATPGSPQIAEDCPRALHARLLTNAAARRLRAIERKASYRFDDADYWLHAAPVAVDRATALRCSGRLPRLP